MSSVLGRGEIQAKYTCMVVAKCFRRHLWFQTKSFPISLYHFFFCSGSRYSYLYPPASLT